MKAVLKKLLLGLGYNVQGVRYTPRQMLDPAAMRLLSFDDAVSRLMFDRRSELTFIQVGVFDGVTHDPLRKYIERCGWRGVLVEPQSRAIEKLKKLYANNDRIQPIHAALDGSPGSRSLYTVQGANAPAWAGGLASFSRDVVLRHEAQIPNIASMISEECVPCISFDSVLSRLPTAPDLLQIDTEGADAFILSLFPFDRVCPAIVHWEIKHLSKVERESCMEQLSGFGYRFAPSGEEDMLAVNF